MTNLLALVGLLTLAACGDNQAQRPQIDELSPARGALAGNTAVTMSGDNLAGDVRVTIGDRLVTDLEALVDGTVRFRTPPGVEPGPVDVIVFNPDGSTLIADGFSYNPLPTITALVPDRGSHLGSTVSVIGTGFEDLEPGANAVRFGDLDCINPTVMNDTTITCAAPPGPTWRLVDVEVENANGIAELANGFGYMRPGLFTADGRGGIDGMLFFVDPGTAESIAIGAIGVPITGLSAHIDGDLYAVTSNGNGTAAGFPRDLVLVDPFTGAAETIGPLLDSGVPVKIPDIAFEGDTLYGWSRTNDDLVEIDRATGEVTLIGDTGIVSRGGGFEVDVSGNAFVAPDGSDGDLDSLALATGAITGSVTMDDTEADDINSLTSFGGVLLGVREGVSQDGVTRATLLISIDPGDGTVTEIGELPFGNDAVTRTPPLPFL